MSCWIQNLKQIQIIFENKFEKGSEIKEKKRKRELENKRVFKSLKKFSFGNLPKVLILRSIFETIFEFDLNHIWIDKKKIGKVWKKIISSSIWPVAQPACSLTPWPTSRRPASSSLGFGLKIYSTFPLSPGPFPPLSRRWPNCSNRGPAAPRPYLLRLEPPIGGPALSTPSSSSHAWRELCSRVRRRPVPRDVACAPRHSPLISRSSYAALPHPALSRAAAVVSLCAGDFILPFDS